MEIEDNNQIDTRWQEHQAFFSQYLANQTNTDAINKMLTNNETRLTIDLDDIRSNNGTQIADDIINYPQKAISALRGTLNKIIDNIDSDGLTKKKKFQDITEKSKVYQLTFSGNMGRCHVTPRGLKATLVNKLVCVNGIVTRMSLSRSKLLRSVHYCEETQQSGPVKDYEDQYDLGQTTFLNPNNSIPTMTENRPLIFEYGYSRFKDFQTIILQGLPENAPNGLLPRSIDVVLEEDLVGKVKPGDRVRVFGVYKCLKSEQTKFTGIMRSVLVATSVLPIIQQEDNDLSGEDIQNIKQISKKKELIDLFVNSIAPSIYGHDRIKKALLLQLLGGTEKIVGTGTHLRGDINVLMIGDPSTAKSQILRYMLATAPLALNTTGRGSSGVGLTAAVKTDRETGERHLEAGAMVLADKGIVCIDEFDKMSEEDRVAIHEVMEQQTVTIAKAGIHCSLNARCAVLAAANPIYGEYNRNEPPTKNIGLPDSLLSRFDLLFIVLDEKDAQIDRLIAERVTRNHRYRPENYEILNQLNQFQGDENDEYIIEPTVQSTDGIENKNVFEKYNKVLHGPNKKETLNQNFIKKYIAYAKNQFNAPKLQDDSVKYITLYYNMLRQRNLEESKNTGGIKVLPITTRTLETVIRLATACAKLRLSMKIEVEDCKVAVRLLNYSIFQNEDEVIPEEEETQAQQSKQGQKDASNKNKATAAKEIKPKGISTNQQVYEEEAKRETRSSQKLISAVVEQKQTTPLKEKQDKKQINTQMKKIKIDDGEEAENAINKQVIASIKLTNDQKKTVYKVISKLVANKTEKTKTILSDDIWKCVQSTAEYSKHVTEKKILERALIELSDDNKIIYETKTKEIYLL